MNRVLTDDHYDTIIAIKQNNFDEFWKKRCRIDYVLSDNQKHSIISQLALETFEKQDWFNFQEFIQQKMNNFIAKKRYTPKKRKEITLKQLTECYMTAIKVMQMVYDD